MTSLRPRRAGPAGPVDDRNQARAVLVIGIGVGLVVGLAPVRWDALLLLAVAVVVIALIGALLRAPAPRRNARRPLTGRQVLALASLYLVMASTLVFRQRTADELAADPLDFLGQFRVIALVGAGVLAAVSMLSRRFTLRGVPAAGWLVIAYLAIVPIGMIEAVSVSLVLFKWGELCTFVLVWLALMLAFPGETSVALRHFGIVVGLELTAVLLGVLLIPHQTLLEPDAFIPFQIQGHLPQMHANDVGTLGLVVVAFGLGRTRISAGLVALGTAVVIAAQYRTGYIAIFVMVVLVLVLRRHAAARILLVVLAVALPIAAQASIIEQAWLRDEVSAANITTLTGRTTWWAEAIDVADRSPIIGVGLSSGVRFEVLQARLDGAVSTIHSTWVEAYVGAGLLGVSLLGAAVVAAFAGGLRRWRWDGDVFPLVILTLVIVKSITSSTIDVGGQLFMLFLLAVAASADRPPSRRSPAVDDPTSGTAQAAISA